MTGPVPRHDHQTLDQWAQQGLVNSEGRTSPESDLPPVPDGADPGAATTAAADRPADQGRNQDQDQDQNQNQDRNRDLTDRTTDRGAPGSSVDPGNLAESEAFTGDGAYSGGRHATGPLAG